MKDLVEFLSSAKWLDPAIALAFAAFFAVTLAVIAKADALFQIFERSRGLRLKELNDLRSLIGISNETKEAITEEIDRAVFAKITRLDWPSADRAVVHKCIQNPDPPISYRDIYLAHSYIEVDNASLKVKISRFDSASSSVLTAIGMTLFVLGSLNAMLASLSFAVDLDSDTRERYMTLLSAMAPVMLCWSLALMMALMARPARRAQRVRDALNARTLIPKDAA